MFRSGIGMLRYGRVLAPLVAAVVAAGGGVVAVSRQPTRHSRNRLPAQLNGRASRCRARS